MKIQKGFTLIELMVVMAIIAILATAGLSAYTGYIKKARDATRIADLNAINTIIQGAVSINGLPPQTPLDAYIAIADANNGKPILDPLVGTGMTTKEVCYYDNSGTTLWGCAYGYALCADKISYELVALFESTSNLSLYIPNSGYTIGNCNFLYDDGANQVVRLHCNDGMSGSDCAQIVTGSYF